MDKKMGKMKSSLKNICKASLLLILLVRFEPILAQPISLNVELLGHWQNENLPRLNGYQIWNDLTGYYDSITGKEYIIAGTTDSIYFFDVTNPKEIVLCDVEDGRSKNMVNRDYECYSHYAYCVSDNKDLGSLQVFDLHYLPDSVHKVYDSDSLSYNTHSIFIEAKSKRLYMCINRLKVGGVSAMDIMSLENPEYPTLIGRLNIPSFGNGTPAFTNVHETYVRNDTAYCSVEYRGIFIFDLIKLDSQKLISIIADYPENGYNHNGTLDKSGKYLMFTDEIPGGLSVKIYDIYDIKNPKLMATFRSNQGATAHNPYWVGSFAYVSYYHDGFFVFNLSDPSNPFMVGYYHTSPWPPPNYEGYKGCWGVYPWLPSGNIAASDMGEGIFLFKLDSSITSLVQTEKPIGPRITPNPFNEKLSFSSENGKIFPMELSIYDSKGEMVLHKKAMEATFETETSNLKPGMYFVLIQTEDMQWVQKMIKQ
jgi:choice-of-anchor B domain-containing protein